jgi:tRNA-specific 2-thiouridylase
MGADYIATGHYARITQGENIWRLLKGVDPSKDQSYVLFNLTQEEMKRTLLPVGWYSKEDIRRIAREAKLPVADKPDSQEICFIPDGNYRQFLEERIPSRPGNMVDSHGNILGRHPGIANFTVGQRRGLGVASAIPLYVLELDAQENRVVVGDAQELEETDLWAEDLNYITGCEPSGPIEVAAKIRYKAREVPATLYPEGDRARVEFHEPQRALTPGQAVVFYHGEEVLGGGIINRRLC